jgi:hypothetical protein
MKKPIYLFAMVILLSGCAVNTASRIKSAYLYSAFYEGMSFDQVVKLVGRRPSAKLDTYELSFTSAGVISIRWVVGAKLSNGGWEPFDSYEFKFVNRKLVDWTSRRY